jgi:hypothetical protein
VVFIRALTRWRPTRPVSTLRDKIDDLSPTYSATGRASSGSVPVIAA